MRPVKNPFNYLQFARGDQFYDRREILADLRSRFLSGPCNVVLYGPRRYGKSSLVAELAVALEQAGIPCISLDVVKVPTIELFVSAYATKVYRRLAPVKYEFRRIGEFFHGMRPTMSIGDDGEAVFSFDVGRSGIGTEDLTEVIDLPQRLLSGDKRAVVILDEFQEVKDLLPNDRFERIMRSAIQEHRNVSYLFLGSRHHILRRMFTEHNRPFYKSAITIPLGKPPLEESIAFVMSRFAEAGKEIERIAAEHLVAKIENIPYYIQQLGFETFRLADDAGKGRIAVGDVEAAFALLSGFNRDQYEQQMLTLSSSQKALLIALAREQTATFDSAYRLRHSLGLSSTVNSAKKKLLEDGVLETDDGRCHVADPLFAEYLRVQ